MVYSKIQYGIEIYGYCTSTLLKKIQTLQNKLLKVLYKFPYRMATSQLHYELKLLKVKDIRTANVLKFVYDSLTKRSIKREFRI